MSIDLSPAEAVVLLMPNGAPPIDVVKRAFMELVVLGLVTLEPGGRGGFLGLKKQPALVSCHDRAEQVRELSEPTRAFYLTVRDACAIGPRHFPELVKALRVAYGPKLDGFMQRHVIPSLIARGYLAPEQTGGFFGFFKSTRYMPTATGRAAQEELDAKLSEAAEVPSFIQSDPARAAATVASLGLLAILVDELRPIRGGLYDTYYDSSPASMGDGGAARHPLDLPLQLPDQDVWDALDAANNALDGGFDSPFDSDSGGDSGGGDSGGGD